MKKQSNLFNKTVLFLLIGFSLNGCSVGLMSIRSTPEGAEVLLAREGSQPVKIGQTPLNLPADRVNNQPGQSAQIIVRKDGYKQENFLVPRVLFSSSIELSVMLSEDKLPAACTNQAQAAEKLSRGIAEAQFLIQTKDYQQAEILLNNLVVDNPNISVLWDLLGNIYYLKKDTQAALKAYEKSEVISPGRVNTIRMINKLRTIQTIRTPAGSDL
ncbi:MAG: hypothetical protein KDD58_08915 [Bdellovibrionales bacterium]|nr:hypothetical protein [Bdellovibrionales bacterium]